MKSTLKLLLLAILFASVPQSGFSDTIDYYHIFIGDEIIKFNQIDFEQPIVFNQKRHSVTPPTVKVSKTKLKELKKITVKYFSDTPCSDCNFYLNVNSEKTGKTLQKPKNKGQGNPLDINTKRLLRYANKTSETKFEVEYYKDNIETKKVIFYLEIE